MIVGHYAAALLPYAHKRFARAPLWYFLLCANVPEFLWLVLAFAGVETPTPGSMLEATFSNLKVQMTYSHNLGPTLIQAAAFGAVTLWIAKRLDLALAGAGLVLFHTLCDFVIGFEHQFWSPDGPNLALNSYGRIPHIAVLLEAAFAAACVFYYFRVRGQWQTRVPAKKQAVLYVALLVGILAWFPAAKQPLGSLFR